MVTRGGENGPKGWRGVRAGGAGPGRSLGRKGTILRLRLPRGTAREAPEGAERRRGSIGTAQALTGSTSGGSGSALTSDFDDRDGLGERLYAGRDRLGLHDRGGRS